MLLVTSKSIKALASKIFVQRHASDVTTSEHLPVCTRIWRVSKEGLSNFLPQYVHGCILFSRLRFTFASSVVGDSGTGDIPLSGASGIGETSGWSLGTSSGPPGIKR